MATITITQTGSHIIFTNSLAPAEVINVPKRNLTILQRIDKSSTLEYVHLNWPAGGSKALPAGIWHKDDYKLRAADVTSPTLADNDALVALLLTYAADIESGASGAGGGSIVYTNAAGDFTATANAGTKTITITGLPFTLEEIHVVGGSMKKIDVDDKVSTVPLTDVKVTVGVITLEDADDFVATDTVYVTLIGPDKWYDRDQDHAKMNNENPDYAHYTDISGDLVTDAEVGDEFGDWIDQGSEIPCASYNVCRAWVEFTVNDSTVSKLRALAKHESGGSDEYEMDDFGEVSLGTSNMKKCYVIPIDHTTPYLQIQTKTGFAEEGGVTTTTTTVGHTNGTISIKYTLGYK